MELERAKTMDFKDKVALITGGTSGIGFTVAKKLAENDAKVVIVGRNKEKGKNTLAELRQINANVEFLSADITKSEQVKSVLRQTLDCFGGLDLAFNNAANDEITHAPTHEFSEEDYDRLMDITLKSVWLSLKYELQIMYKQKSGVIVNTSSVDALLCSAGTAVYSAGKSGVIALSKSIAQEYGKHGIRVNTVSPGAIRTPLLEKKFVNMTKEEALQLESKYREFNALGKIGTPDEAAEVVLWLLSDKASYVTGQNIVVDGGICFI